MGAIQHQPGQVATHVRVPGVGVQHVGVGRDRGRHGQVSSQHPQGGVRLRWPGLRVCDGAVAGFAHAVHVDVDELLKLRDELGHVDPGTAVDGWRVLTSQQRQFHASQ